MESQNPGTYLQLYLSTVATLYKMNSTASHIHYIAKLRNFICGDVYCPL